MIQGEKCGFNSYHQEKLATDPIYLQKTNEFNQMMRNYVPSKSNATYKIPVVVHVISDGTTLTAITDQQIKDAIKGLNERLRKLAGGLGDGSGVDLEIEYALAVRDPNGNCTDGIVRYDYSGNATYTSFGVRRSGGSGTTDATLKALSVWNQSTYYNMWLVSEIDNNNGRTGTQGYAAFAGSHGSSTDGSVMLVNTFKNPSGTTLIHELGHSLNLYHTFEGDDSGCPVNTDCSTDGDQVCDTPPHEQSSSDCVVGVNGCDGGSSTELFIHNYMDYSSDVCQNMLTDGQKTRMHAAISGTRSSFLEANGNMALVPVDAPSANFYASRYYMCAAGQTVNLYDQSTCSPNTYMAETTWTGITYSWSITNNAGTTYTSTVQNPVITMGATGTYDVTLIITNAEGSSTYTKAGMIIVGSTTADAFCTPSSSNEGNFLHTVSNVTFNTINNSSSMLNNTEYSNNACTMSTIVSPNTTYSMSVTINAGGSGAEALEVYIDYNSDGDFVDGGEQVLTGSTATGTTTIVTGNVTIPAGVTVNTPLRMRVIADAGTISAADRTCSIMFIGEVEDYTVYASNNIATVSIATTPSTTLLYGVNTTFTATPVNGGATPTYRWFKNDVVIPGQITSTYASATLLDDDEIYCELTSDLAGVIASPCSSNVVILTVTGSPISGFSANVTSGCTSTTFNFTDESLLAPTSWSWTFAGGTPATSTSQNPTVTFAGTGLHTVTLVATNALGTGTTETKTDYILIYTTPAASCVSTRTNSPTAGIGITNVTLNTINNNTVYNGAVMNDYICSNSTTLTTSTLYNISATVGSPNAQWLRAYIDYNNDGDFADAGENIWSPADGTNVMSGSFTVPASPTLNTLLKMRVITDFNGSTAAAVCRTPLGYGQVEEYGIIITPSCTTPTVGSPVSDSRCGTGTLDLGATPSAGIINWYDASSGGTLVGTGTAFTTPSISSTTTYYAEAVDGSCISASRTAIVATVTSIPTVGSPVSDSRCGTGTLDLGATPSAGIINWYDASSGGTLVGTGTTFTTPSISVTTPYYAEAVDGSCISASRTSISATVNDCSSTLNGASCNVTLVYLTDALNSTAVSGATNYRYLIENLATGFSTIVIRNASDNLFRMSWPTSGIKYGTTYTVKVASYVDGNWGAYGSACNVSTPLTKLQTSFCNITLANLTDAIYCYPVVDATKYRFQVTHAGSSFNQVANSSVLGNNFFRMSWFTSGIIPGATYTVQAAAYVGGSWMSYGPSCTITTPSTLTQLTGASCNVTIPSLSTALYSDVVSGATNYRYKVVNSGLGFSKVITRAASDNLCRLSWTSGILANTTYNVQVSAYLNGVWQAYGPVCTVMASSSLAKKPTEEINNEELGDLISVEAFPNPNSGDFTISSSHEGQLNLVNELGQVIRTIEITKENNYQTKVEGLDNGVYFVTGTINNEVVTQKVMVINR